MSPSEKVDLTILSEKGQVVIPAKIRSRMGLKPKTKFLVYEYRDSVILENLKNLTCQKNLKPCTKGLMKESQNMANSQTMR